MRESSSHDREDTSGAFAPLLRGAVGELLTGVYFVGAFVIFFTHGDLFARRSDLIMVRPIALYFALFAPLVAVIIASDIRNGLRTVFTVWRRNAAVLLPLLALVVVGFVAAQLPEANWSGGGKYVLYPIYTLAGVMLAMLLPLLRPVRRSLKVAVAISFAVLTVTVAADVVSPALFSKLPSRASGLPSDPNAAAALLVVACVLLLDWQRQRRRDAILLALTGAALVPTFSRAGFLLYVLLLMGYVLTALQRRERWWTQVRKTVPIAIAAVAVVGGLALVRTGADEGMGMLGRHRAQQRVQMFTGGESLLSDTGDRREIVVQYLHLISASPWLGRGTGFSYSQPKGPHVRYLQEWVNGGLAGLLCLLTFFAMALVLAYRRRDRAAIAFVCILASWALFNHVLLEYRSVLMTLGLVMTGSLWPPREALNEGEPS